MTRYRDKLDSQFGDPELHKRYGHPGKPMIQMPAEFASLLDIFIDRKPLNVLEIGTQHGGSLGYWLMHSREQNAKVISLDINHAPLGDVAMWGEDADRLTLVTGDSTASDTIKQVVALMPSIDFLFIDGNHAHPYPTQDFENYGPLVRPGGVIAFHDIVGTPDGDGVIRLWEKLRKDGYICQEFTTPGQQWFGIGVIYKESGL